jgi:hypothetical protein
MYVSVSREIHSTLDYLKSDYTYYVALALREQPYGIHSLQQQH